jgi:alkanesulfonate monooxygenase SsuD/methylene tetrahydromethanopterin reductase-like flavin-dependent oxidoreductase (luciferase family)
MKALWTQPRATMSGNFWRFENVPMEPRPLQQPHPPIWFGARTEIGIKRAVRHGDGWMGAGSSSSADFVQHVEWLRRFLAAANRDPATFPISKRVYLAVDDNKSRAEQRLREWFGRRYLNADMATQVSIWGGLQECLDKLGELVRAGAQHLLLNPVFDEMEHMELLAREVVPRL